MKILVMLCWYPIDNQYLQHRNGIESENINSWNYHIYVRLSTPHTYAFDRIMFCRGLDRECACSLRDQSTIPL
jgi:hypothetical protein